MKWWRDPFILMPVLLALMVLALIIRDVSRAIAG